MLKKISAILYYGFAVLIFMLILLLIGTRFTLPGDFKVLVVESGSMQPAIKTGSLVITKSASAYRPGDIITYAAGGGILITHRLHEVISENGRLSYITKGDANSAADTDPVKAGQVKGRVLLSLPYAGFAVDTAKTPWGFGLIIGLPALIIILDELKKIKEEIVKIFRRKRNKKEDDSIINLKE